MNKWLTKLYEKGELLFAILWIVIYCVTNSLTNELSRLIGIDSSITFVWNAFLTLILLLWVKKGGFFEKYGLCRPKAPIAKFLWYLPLLLIVSQNFWCGAAMNLPALDTVFYVCNMLCVGFLEEIIFRGFLFKALAKENVKMAIIISSITFGLGHLLNLINGSGMDLVANLCQVFGAIAIGFLFVILFHRGKSLLPCIIVHAAINVTSVFANEAGLTASTQILFSILVAAIAIVYACILQKTLPKTE